MSTRRCEHLIRRVRQRSDNLDYGTEAGISDEQIVDYLNEGLEKLQSRIAEQHSEAFGTSTTIRLVSGKEEYALPDDMLEGAGLLLVEHKFDTQYYRKLNKVSMAERSDGSFFDPRSYVRKGRSIYLRPIPTRGSDDELRIEYVRRWDRIGVRRGAVASIRERNELLEEIVIEGKNYSTGDSFRDEDLKLADYNAVRECDHICLVDRDGNYIHKNIAIDSDAITSGQNDSLVLPILNTDIIDTTDFVGKYVVCEKDTSTHQMELDRTVERFLIHFAVWRCSANDASSESYDDVNYLKSILKDILMAYAVLDESVQYIPELKEY